MYQDNAQQPPPRCPAHTSGHTPIPLYTPDFANDPEASYEVARKLGPAAPVELAPGVEALLVTGYAAAREVLTTPEHFAKDARRWVALQEGQVPADSPILPMMAYRPNCMFADGPEHLRLRQAVTDSLSKVDPHVLARAVGQVAEYLINGFSTHGRVDLLNDYAKAVPLLVFNQLFGTPAETGDQILYGMSAIFDGYDVENANQQLTEGLLALVAGKRRTPGEDVTSWLIQHEAGLNDEEMVHQLVLLMGAGTEPQRNLIANALRLLLGDLRYTDQGFGGGLLIEDAIDDVLWNQPPIANYAAHYAKQDMDLGGVSIPAGVPTLISFAAANNDPAVADARATTSKRAHLAWGAGPHACPAKDQATLIALTAIEKLMNRLPDIELAVPAEQLNWRPGPFHRALESLPARFTAERPQPLPFPTGTAPAAPQERPQAQEPRRSTRWSSFLKWLKG